MIAVDTSALVAIVRREAEHVDFAKAIAWNEIVIGAPVLLEMRIVLQRMLGDDAETFVADLLARPRIEVAPFSFAMYEIAREAFLRFGKGRHPASLNFGDCISYAVARAADIPLLYKGTDFALTDIAPVALP